MTHKNDLREKKKRKKKRSNKGIFRIPDAENMIIFCLMTGNLYSFRK